MSQLILYFCSFLGAAHRLVTLDGYPFAEEVKSWDDSTLNGTASKTSTKPVSHRGATSKGVPSHSIVRPLQCPDCDLSEYEYTKFASHLVVHQRTKILKCCFCKFKANVYWMALHMAKHSADQESSLRSHMERVQSQKGVPKNHQPSFKRHQTENQNSANQQVLVKRHHIKTGIQNIAGSNRVSDASDDEVRSHDGPYDLDTPRGGPVTPETEAIHSQAPAPIDSKSMLGQTPIPPSNTNKPGLSCRKDLADFPTPGRSKLDHGAASYERNKIEAETPDLSRSASPQTRKIFKCEKCTFSALKESLLQLHAAKHHIDVSSECCQIEAGTPDLSRSSSPPTRKFFKCERCPFATQKEPLLQRHSAKHLIDRSFVCEHCGFREINSVKFAKHLASDHSSRRKLYCCFCSYTSLNYRNLAVHLNIHRPVHMADCPECGMTFSRNYRLNRHFRKFHMKGEKRADKDPLQMEKKTCSVAPVSDTAIQNNEKSPPSSAIVAAPSPPVIGEAAVGASTAAVTAASTAAVTAASTAAVCSSLVSVPCKPFYQCSSCNFSTKRKALLKSHVAKHLLPESYLVCPICEFAESSAHAFVAHLMSHESRNRLDCCFCQHICSRPKELRRHIEVHRGVHFYDCPMCGKTYTQFAVLRMHCKTAHVMNVQRPDRGKLTAKSKLHSQFREHRSESKLKRKRQPLQERKQERVDPVPKDDDALRSGLSSTLFNDPQTVSSENNPKSAPAYRCDSCDYGTNIELLHSRHVAKHDMEEAQFVCPTCQFKTDQLLSFARHLTTHGDSTNCCFCAFKTYCKSSLVRHLESHRSVHFKDCSMCERSYARQSSLNNHYSKYHIQKKDCPDCGESMTYFELLEHNKTHGKPIDATFKDSEMHDPSALWCYHCKYSTVKKSLLRRHALKHLADTRIVCPDCDFREHHAREFAKHCVSCQGGLICCFCSYSTNGLNNLSYHVEIHRNTLIYDCAKCEFSSTTRSNLREHYKNMHITKHQCGYCDKTMTRYRLNRHKLKHLASGRAVAGFGLGIAEPGQESLHGGFSDFSTAVQSSFDEHSAAHATSSVITSGVQEGLLCGYCDFSADDRSLLEEHLAMHAEQDSFSFDIKSEPTALNVAAECVCGQRPLLCSYCDFSTDAQPLLDDHLTKHAHLANVNIKSEPTLNIDPELTAPDPNVTDSVLNDPLTSDAGSDMIEHFENVVDPSSNDDMCIDSELSGFMEL